MKIIEINAESLKEICSLTAKLTEFRQNECKQLCVENVAPEIFGKLIDEYLKRVSIELEK